MDRCLLSQEQTRERERRKPDFWPIVSPTQLRSSSLRSASALWQKGGTTPCTAAERWNWALKHGSPPSLLPFFPVLLSLSPEFFQPNSSAALLNLRALEVAWASKRDGGCPRGLTVRLGSLQKIAGKVARALFSDIALCLESQYQKNASSQIKLYRRRRLFKPSACRDLFLVRHRLKKRSFRENSRNPRVLCRRRFETLLRSRSARGPLSNKRSY